MPKPHKEDALADIYKSAEAAVRYVAGVTYEQFLTDEVLQDALIRRLEIIGEATKRYSQFAPGIRAAHPEIPWRDMAGMRDVLIHCYDVVDLDEVWKAVTEVIPAILPHLHALCISDEPHG
ncbi:MAG TPA: DUF86 domain-containing protein [Armatimonadota bacterium]|jgi:uncharacterized protein with HEPN domain